ncbi:MAG: MBL fold metallo-hydrolase [Bacteroidetes bacterium]|jgi:hydroxyacylglutathione hydrolase|nr:MBL fold metallo-hydrolase [Bacteroidota bacterium]
MYVEQLYTSCLAEAAYYIESKGEAAIIDPLRETEPYLELARQRGATIKYIFETHFHADFVSGHIDLSHKTGAPIVFGPNAKPSYTAHVAEDGACFQIGDLTIQVLHTPGHTMESTTFLLKDESGKDHAIFTGDTLFIGDVGRPDLAVKSDLTQEDLAGLLYDSLHAKILPLADAVIVYPGHGAGSQCGKNMSKETTDTLGNQKKVNYALQNIGKAQFIQELTTGILPPPAYFPENVRLNKGGYESLDVVMERGARPLSPRDFELEMEQGTFVLDTRNPDDYERGHIPGSINIGLNGQYAVWVGTVVPFGARLALVPEPGKEEESILRLSRVGYDNVAGYLAGGMDAWTQAGKQTGTVRSIEAESIAQALAMGAVILDVRGPGEYETGHIRQAMNVPLADLQQRLAELKPDQPYVVHCAGGYRSMIACSILKRAGYQNLQNVYGGYNRIKQEAGLEFAEGACPSQQRAARLGLS